jgi:hypothetical protein
MDPEQRAHILQELADGIARRRLATPTRVILDAIEPLGFLASQVALFARPLTPLGRWRDYATALEDEEGWKVLRTLVGHQDS